MAEGKGERFFTNADWWIAILTFALVVVTYFSLRVIRGQLDEMKSAGKQTDQMLEIASKQAEIATKQAEAAAINARAATSAADSARRALLLSERAWVGVLFAHIDTMMTETKAHAIIWIQNASRGTAHHVHVLSDSGYYEGDLPANPPYRARRILFSDRMLLPGDKFQDEIFSRDIPTVEELSKIAQPDMKARYYVWSTITYVDVFGKKHQTKFCGYYDPRGQGDLITCPFYNDAD